MEESKMSSRIFAALALVGLGGGCSNTNWEGEAAADMAPSLPLPDGGGNADVGFSDLDSGGGAADLSGAAPDLSGQVTDFAVAPPDLAAGGDLSRGPDLAVLPDLTRLPDLAVLPDLTRLPDLAVLPDLTRLPDLGGGAVFSTLSFSVPHQDNGRILVQWVAPGWPVEMWTVVSGTFTLTILRGDEDMRVLVSRLDNAPPPPSLSVESAPAEVIGGFDGQKTWSIWDVPPDALFDPNSRDKWEGRLGPGMYWFFKFR